MEKQRELPLSSFEHAQEQLPQVPPAFDAAMRFAGQTQRQHAGDSDAYLSTFEILQGSQGNGSQALWILLAEAANAKAENGLVRSLQGCGGYMGYPPSKLKVYLFSSLVL